jgi:hypothetical protein
LLRIEAKFQKLNQEICYKNLQYKPQSKALTKEGEPIFLSKKQQELFHLKRASCRVIFRQNFVTLFDNPNKILPPKVCQWR